MVFDQREFDVDTFLTFRLVRTAEGHSEVCAGLSFGSVVTFIQYL